MKKITQLLTVATLVVASSLTLMAQGPNMGVNGNYKHQYPTSKGNKFKDSFKNESKEDVSVRNYKIQSRYKKTENNAFSNNFSAIKKQSTVDSKHPYGL